MMENKTIKVIKIVVPTFFLVVSYLFWMIGRTQDIYKNAFVGTMFEILWLPMILVTLIIPVFSFFMWYKDGFSFKSFFIYLAIFAGINFYLVFR